MDDELKILVTIRSTHDMDDLIHAALCSKRTKAKTNATTGGYVCLHTGGGA
jgi:hypothetical protein